MGSSSRGGSVRKELSGKPATGLGLRHSRSVNFWVLSTGEVALELCSEFPSTAVSGRASRISSKVKILSWGPRKRQVRGDIECDESTGGFKCGERLKSDCSSPFLSRKSTMLFRSRSMPSEQMCRNQMAASISLKMLTAVL